MGDLMTAVRRTVPSPVVQALKRTLPAGIRSRLAARRNWSIGLYGGRSPLRLGPLSGIVNPILTADDVTDVAAAFVADPFAIERGGQWHLLFEVLDQDSGRGVIALATSTDLRRWTYQGVVLREPFHLSYPHVFEWAGEVYLTPEAAESGSVLLYRARAFPTAWELVGHILEGSPLLDPTVFRSDDRWWLFAGAGGQDDELRLYSSSHLTSGWVEHSRSPIVSGGVHHARPAGRVAAFDGRLVRFAQDCYPAYGSRVTGFEITSLSADDYAEQPLELTGLRGSGDGWNAAAMHHVDAHQRVDGSWIAFVDGA